MLKRVGVLCASLMIALVPYFEHLQDEGYVEAFTPEHLVVLLPIVGGVLLSWLGQSPVQKWLEGRNIQ